MLCVTSILFVSFLNIRARLQKNVHVILLEKSGSAMAILLKMFVFLFLCKLFRSIWIKAINCSVKKTTTSKYGMLQMPAGVDLSLFM